MAHGVVDAAIIGGGIIGASIAERIQCSEPSWRCVIFEAEEAPGTGETRWATGGVRHQFGTEPNIRLSLISVPVFENFPDEYGIDPAFRRHGYLFVTADEKRLALMDRERELQNSLGVPTQRLDREQLRKHCPPLFVDDLLGGNFCALDGSIEPAWVLQGYIDNFRRHGGSLATAAPVVEIEHTGTTWRLTTPRATYDTPIVVIACGPHTRAVAALAKLDVPVQPYARQVFVAQALPAIPPVIPLTIDIDTGWYIHAHHAELLLGGTDKETRPLDGATADVDWTAFETVYHAATHRMPALAEANILHAYAGARTLTPDHHPILGPVETHPGIYLACGLSGHGIMHAPAVGILLAEWVTEGRPRTWDARPLTI
ncbi:MAG: FAD-binding oxidoreductase, partial [Candidatus Eremiobacteraeota bacterium]|nr:FAD-binding oxidoreductase [Candidatus Eremiobacteraeota bacterium]